MSSNQKYFCAKAERYGSNTVSEFSKRINHYKNDKKYEK